MRRHGFMAYGAGPALLAAILLAALVWGVTARSTSAHGDSGERCSGSYHHHSKNPHKCHKHCKNGMSKHNRTHGENCARRNPTPKPKPTPTRKPTPTPRPTATLRPTATARPTATLRPTATVPPTPAPTAAPTVAPNRLIPPGHTTV